MSTNSSRRILFFPFGQDSGESCSFYLEHYSEEDIPNDWYCCAQFALVLWNPTDPKILSFKTTQHRFTKAEGDWGFTTFENMRKLFTQEWDRRGKTLVENESANMTVYVRVVKDETGILWHTFRDYDSKKETGYVGLKNQGATCYLNSLLQSLYFTNAFRKVCIHFTFASRLSMKLTSAGCVPNTDGERRGPHEQRLHTSTTFLQPPILR